MKEKCYLKERRSQKGAVDILHVEFKCLSLIACQDIAIQGLKKKEKNHNCSFLWYDYLQFGYKMTLL